jgi:hypothetical protein
LQSPTVAD